jgi:hypothetical protein
MIATTTDRQRKRIRVDRLSDAEFAALQQLPRACASPTCRAARPLTYADFPVTLERGCRFHRRCCKECLAAYYATRTAPERFRLGHRRRPSLRRERIAALLYIKGSLRVAEIAAQTGMRRIDVWKALAHEWFAQANAQRWEITNAVRQMLMADEDEGGSATRTRKQQPYYLKVEKN